MVGKGIVSTVQEAFDRYLVKCDVPKYPLTLEEASDLVRGAGGVMVIAHPDDPGGTSLAVIAPDLESRGRIMREYMLRYIDGVECWHPRHDARATAFYAEFARHHNLLATGGSDCHQKPVIMGSVEVPEYVARQFASVPPVTVWQSERN
jgi:predicted metal-dependent phosphoesterase TrpH